MSACAEAVQQNDGIDVPPLNHVGLTSGPNGGILPAAGPDRVALHLEALRGALSNPALARTGAIIVDGEPDWAQGPNATERLTALVDNMPWGASICSLEHVVERCDGLSWAGRFPERHNLCEWVPEALAESSAYWISADYARELLNRRAAGWMPQSPTELLDDSDGLAAFPPLGAVGRPSAKPSIALCMIIRDEAAVIGRCLDSVRPLIDSWVICDTGSSDGSVELVQEMLAELPGELHHRPWRDFGHNRSELMEYSRGCADYLLLLDADMTLSCKGPLPALSCDAYLLRHAEEPAYAVPRLVRGDRLWRFRGVVHEHLDSDRPHGRQMLDALVVEHHGDGSARVDKFERDRGLLERELEADPDNARTVFYLAQTYRDLGDGRRASELYLRRAEMSGWDEERFYAAYQAASLMAQWDQDAAAAALLDVWHQRPSRAEPLYELARLRRLQGRYDEAREVARRGLEITRPNDLLFVHRHVYEWGLLFELAVASYWTGDVDLALELNEELLQVAELPPAIEATVRQNRAYCAANGARLSSAQADRKKAVTGSGRGRLRQLRVAVLDELCPSSEVQSLEIEVVPRWPVFNPTIAAAGDGFRMILRSANYRITDGHYEYLTDDGVIRTINHWVALDRDLRPISSDAISDRFPTPPALAVRVRGHEDCRLVRVGDRWLATATVLDRNPRSRCEMALLTLDGAEVTEMKILRGPAPMRHEKNWMPFTVGNQLYALYSCSPTVVMAIDPVYGIPTEVSRKTSIEEGQVFRGGSQGIPVGEGTLFLVHELVIEGSSRAYKHRFVLLDDDFVLAGVSAPFYFLAPQVEFCAGLARRDRQLVMSFGIEDGAAALATVDTDEVLGLLRRAG